MKNENTLRWISFGAFMLTLVAAVLILLLFFMPALSVGQSTGGANFEYKDYTGFDVAIICWPAWILGGQLLEPNPLLITAIFLPLIFTLIGGLSWKNAGSVKRMVFCALWVVSLAFFAFCYLQTTDFVMTSALPRFEEYVFYAKEKGMYKVADYCVMTSVVAILAALANVASIVILAKLPKLPNKVVDEDDED